MLVRRRGPSLEVWAPAKLNLLLEVGGKRADGYHELVTLVTAIRLFDTLYFSADPTGRIELDCHWSHQNEGAASGISTNSKDDVLGDLPQGSDNLAMKAVERLREAAGCDDGARIRLVKRIPSSAGMGGASSDAAAALVAANECWGLKWPKDRLASLAAELGSDVPFFLNAGAAICRGRGERVLPVEGVKPLSFVVVRPPVGLSTRLVYSEYQPREKPSNLESLIAGLKVGDPAAVGRYLVNDLEPVASRLSPWINRVRTELEKQQCVGQQMTGSGSACFGIGRNVRHSHRIAARLRGMNLGRVFTATTAALQ
jgi:4-diphosphocytidyl-2-C-methyl-D-erythritol kinase